jgi:WD40 repeat protein
LYVGTHDGKIALFKVDENGKLSHLDTINAHNGAIYTMAPRKLSPGIITGSKDGNVCIWRKVAVGKLEKEKAFELK